VAIHEESEMTDEKEQQQIEAEFKALLAQVDELERKWLSLPEEQRLALPELAKWFGVVNQ
jgi:hypothetical protein